LTAIAEEGAHSGEALICLLLDSMVVLRANRKLTRQPRSAVLSFRIADHSGA